MSEQTELLGMLELISQPAFCVRDGMIVQINHAAKHYLIEPDSPVAPLLGHAAEEYAQFREGCLFLDLTVGHRIFSASVTPMSGTHVFVLSPEGDQPVLQAMALAARELRNPIADLMLASENLFPELEHSGDDRTRAQILQANRSLYRLMRVVFNMSDASRYTQAELSPPPLQNISAIVREIFEKAAATAIHSGITLRYDGPREEILLPLNEEKLERAVLNMISNAMKFTEKGGAVEASLTRHGNQLHLSVEDNGSGVENDVLSTMHRCYQRSPVLEDPRYGLGLGMTMIRACASAHGGVVLVTNPGSAGTRVTMTLSLRQKHPPILRENTKCPDYACERDHCLLELSDSLPPELYSSKLL